MKLHFLNGGRLRMPRFVFVPEAERGETIELPVISALIRHPGGNVLFDTGCHPKAIADPEAHWGVLARYLVPIGPKDVNLVSSLAELGLTPDDIDVVVNSHLHTDHCGCNAFFKKATFICTTVELDNARASTEPLAAYYPHEFEIGAYETIDGSRDIFGDGRLETVPLPGHTAGLMGMTVGLEREGTFLLASDALSLMRNLEFDEVPKNARDGERLLASYGEIRRLQRAGATVICGHDAAQWAALRTGPEAYA